MLMFVSTALCKVGPPSLALLERRFTGDGELFLRQGLHLLHCTAM